MVNIAITLHLFAGNGIEEVPEEGRAADPSTYQELLERQDVVEGSVEIQSEGQPTVELVDELWAAAFNLGFRCVTAMLRGTEETYLYRFTSSDGHIVAIRHGSWVRLVGEDIPAASYPSSSLLPALYEFGMRVVRVLEHAGEKAVGQVAYLTPVADEARDALLEAGLEVPPI